MLNLYAAAAAFVVMHTLVSGTRARDALVRRLGEGPYMGLFSLGSVAGLVWLILAFSGARGTAGDLEFWGAEPWRKHAALLLVFVGMVLVVVGLLTPSPTSVKGEGALDRPDAARGILRVTRHPFLWGVTLWAAAHLLANGDLASLVLFGCLLLLGLVGPPSIDAKRRRALGERYAAFQAQTSAVPFAAILAGRQRLSLREIGWWRPLVAVTVFALLLAVHPYAFHAYPLG